MLAEGEGIWQMEVLHSVLTIFKKNNTLGLSSLNKFVFCGIIKYIYIYKEYKRIGNSKGVSVF